MSDHHQPPDLDGDDVRRRFNDLVRTELAAPRPACECRCTGEEPHADRPCTAAPGRRRPATTMVALHMYAMCNVRGADIDANGNLCAYMCSRCADHAMEVARRKVGILAVSGQPMECPTCRKPILEAADIIERRPL